MSKIKRFLGGLFCAAAVLALGGCAHPISIAPDVARLQADPAPTRIDHKVGFVISDASRATEVETPGGGGDRVKYQPYRDLEAGLYTVLNQMFSGVSRLQTNADPKIAAEGLQRILVPTVKTESSSSSALTWPPTYFKVELSCQILDAAGRPLGQVQVTGEGRAEFEEFKSEHSLSARRASEDALRKLARALKESPALR